MTPKEVNGRLRAFSAAQQQTMVLMDTLAWMIGQYSAQAYHAPKNYPKKPCTVKANAPRQAGEPLDEDTMKSLLKTYAEIHNTIEEVNNRDAGRT